MITREQTKQAKLCRSRKPILKRSLSLSKDGKFFLIERFATNDFQVEYLGSIFEEFRETKFQNSVHTEVENE